MRRFAAALVAPAFLLLAGCGGGPPATPVEGTVAFSAKKSPANLLVQFHPLAEARDRQPLSGSATTDDAGKFRVKCDDGRDGLPPGKYVVTVIDNNLSTDDEPDGKRRKVPVNRVGVKYMSADEKSNPLLVTVEAGKAAYDLKLD